MPTRRALLTALLAALPAISLIRAVRPRGRSLRIVDGWVLTEADAAALLRE